MASFYRSDEEWTQGEEIPLFNMEEVGEGISMQSCLLEETLPEINDNLFMCTISKNVDFLCRCC